MRGAAERAKREWRQVIAGAHASAYFARVKKLDRLESYLPRERTAGRGGLLARLREMKAAGAPINIQKRKD